MAAPSIRAVTGPPPNAAPTRRRASTIAMGARPVGTPYPRKTRPRESPHELADFHQEPDPGFRCLETMAQSGAGTAREGVSDSRVGSELRCRGKNSLRSGGRKRLG